MKIDFSEMTPNKYAEKDARTVYRFRYMHPGDVITVIGTTAEIDNARTAAARYAKKHGAQFVFSRADRRLGLGIRIKLFKRLKK